MPGIFPDNFIFKYFVPLSTSINVLKSCARDCVYQFVVLKIHSPCIDKKMGFIFHFDFVFGFHLLHINAFKWLLNHWSTPIRKTIHAYVLELDLAKYLFFMATNINETMYD